MFSSEATRRPQWRRGGLLLLVLLATLGSGVALKEVSGTWMYPCVAAAAGLMSAMVVLLSPGRARAREQFQLHMRILDSMAEGVGVADEHGVLLYTNRAEDQMFGYARGELIGQPVTVQNTYPPEENRRIVDEVIAQLRSRGVWTGEFSNVKKDGTPFTTFARISALEIAGRSYWVCVQEDITARKEVERERAELLAREQSLRAAAEEASRTKDEFVAMVSHELRNPLAPITSAIELLAARGGPAIEREVAILERQLRHLRQVVDDLLDFSTLTHDGVALTRRPVQLAALVADALRRVGAEIEERTHEVAVEVAAAGLDVDVDRDRMVQVISNLLSNAAKYTPPGGHIAISGARDGDAVVLRVRDSGAGMDPASLARAFEPFVQGERRVERAKGGLGLGLALVRSLVEAHGGSVAARSEGRGKGSELEVRLPASAAPAPPLDAAARPAGRIRRRVLVVDDNPDAADMLAEILQFGGYEVVVAYHPARALELARDAPVYAAILDIGLPDMDGYELAARLPGAPRPVLIAVTGYGRDVDRARSREAGFAHHLVKPVSPKELLGVLETI